MEVIVYRNPLEKMMWETYTNNPEYILYGIGIAISVVAILIISQKIKDKFKRKWNN